MKGMIFVDFSLLLASISLAVSIISPIVMKFIEGRHQERMKVTADQATIISSPLPVGIGSPLPHTGTCLIDKITISYLARAVKINGEKMVKKEAGFAPASMP